MERARGRAAAARDDDWIVVVVTVQDIRGTAILKDERSTAATGLILVGGAVAVSATMAGRDDDLLGDVEDEVTDDLCAWGSPATSHSTPDDAAALRTHSLDAARSTGVNLKSAVPFAGTPRAV
jgi:hypothetical protein